MHHFFFFIQPGCVALQGFIQTISSVYILFLFSNVQVTFWGWISPSKFCLKKYSLLLIIFTQLHSSTFICYPVQSQSDLLNCEPQRWWCNRDTFLLSSLTHSSGWSEIWPETFWSPPCFFKATVESNLTQTTPNHWTPLHLLSPKCLYPMQTSFKKHQIISWSTGSRVCQLSAMMIFKTVVPLRRYWRLWKAWVIARSLHPVLSTGWVCTRHNHYLAQEVKSRQCVI